jgi:uncharacterized membrane protein YdbT with pleckstrin-like domain
VKSRLDDKLFAPLPADGRARRGFVAQAEGSGGTAVSLPMRDVLPAHLLDGGEVVHFAIKPSPWFLLLVSLRTLLAAALVGALAWTEVLMPDYRDYAFQLALLVAALRLGWAILEWTARLYVLTNRRVMSIRGILRPDVFACPLQRVQRTELTASAGERAVRAGTILIHTKANGDEAGKAAWAMVSRPNEVFERLHEAVERAHHKGNHA